MLDGANFDGAQEMPPLATTAMLALCAATILAMGYTLHSFVGRTLGGWGGLFFGPFVTPPPANARFMEEILSMDPAAQEAAATHGLRTLTPTEVGAVQAYHFFQRAPKPFRGALALRSAERLAARVAALRQANAAWSVVTPAIAKTDFFFRDAIRQSEGRCGLMALLAVERFAAFLQGNGDTAVAAAQWASAGTTHRKIAECVQLLVDTGQDPVTMVAPLGMHESRQAAAAWVSAAHCDLELGLRENAVHSYLEAEADLACVSRFAKAAGLEIETAHADLAASQARIACDEIIADTHRTLLHDATAAAAATERKSGKAATRAWHRLYPPWTEYADLPWATPESVRIRLNAAFMPIILEIQTLRSRLERIHADIEGLRIDSPLDAVAAEVLEVVAGWMRQTIALHAPLASRAERERYLQERQAEALRCGAQLERVQNEDVRETAADAFGALLEAVQRHRPLHPEAEAIARDAVLAFIRRHPEWTDSLLATLMRHAAPAPDAVFDTVAAIGLEQPGLLTRDVLDVLQHSATRDRAARRAVQTLHDACPELFVT